MTKNHFKKIPPIFSIANMDIKRWRNFLDHYTRPTKTLAGILHGSRTFGGPIQGNLRLINRCKLIEAPRFHLAEK